MLRILAAAFLFGCTLSTGRMGEWFLRTVVLQPHGQLAASLSASRSLHDLASEYGLSAELVDAVRFMGLPHAGQALRALLQIEGREYTRVVNSGSDMTAGQFCALHRNNYALLETYVLMSGSVGKMALSEYLSHMACFYAFVRHATNGVFDRSAWLRFLLSTGLSHNQWPFADVTDSDYINTAQFAAFFKYVTMSGGERDMSYTTWALRHPGANAQDFLAVAHNPDTLYWEQWRALHWPGLGIISLMIYLGDDHGTQLADELDAVHVPVSQ